MMNEPKKNTVAAPQRKMGIAVSPAPLILRTTLVAMSVMPQAVRPCRKRGKGAPPAPSDNAIGRTAALVLVSLISKLAGFGPAEKTAPDGVATLRALD
jgi:hypothetical protein